MPKLFNTDPLNVALGSYELTLTGKIYADVAPQLKTELMSAVDKGLKFLLVNAETLEQIDSSGLNVFVTLLKKIRPSGGKIAFFGLNGNIQRVFDITKLATVMGVFEERGDALGSFA